MSSRFLLDDHVMTTVAHGGDSHNIVMTTVAHGGDSHNIVMTTVAHGGDSHNVGHVTPTAQKCSWPADLSEIWVTQKNHIPT